jgi:hypothetical protein
MRYHWGLGIGHLHAHQYTLTSAPIPEKNTRDVQPSECELEETLYENDVSAQVEAQDGNSEGYHSDNPELCLEERDNEGWEDVELESSEDENETRGEDEDVEELDADFTGM